MAISRRELWGDRPGCRRAPWERFPTANAVVPLRRRFCYPDRAMPKPRATTDQIRSFRGSLKLQPGEKSATQELLEGRAEDKRLEEAKWTRFENRMQRKRKRVERSGGKG